MNRFLQRTLAIALALTIVATGYAADGESLDRIVKVKIGAQSLSTALIEFSRQTRVQVVTPASKVSHLSTQGVSGEMPLSRALSKLLEGTDLGFHSAGANTIGLDKTERTTSSPADAPPVRLALRDVSTKSTENVASESSGDAVQDAPAKLEEILVTAQKREERLRDVPISIVALDSKALRERGVTSLDDLAAVAPGLTVQDNGGFQRRVVLRGISNVYGNSSLVGMYLNEASVTAEPTMQLDLRAYDLQRVEVLRGPQGTLYGDGSVGGTVRFITNPPQLDRLDANVNVAAELTRDGSPGERIEGAVNLPLVADQLAVRIAGTFNHLGGWVDQPLANRDDFNSQDVTDVRVTSLWRPTERLSASAMAIVHRNEAPPPNGEDGQGNFTQVFNLAIAPHARDDYELYNLTTTYEADAFQVLNTATYLDQSKNVGYSLHFPAFGAVAFIPDSPRGALVSSDELRVTSTGDSPLRWTFGGFYRKARFDSALDGYYFGAPTLPGEPLPGPPFDFAEQRRFESWAAFGDASYRFGRLTVGAGVRYFEERQQYASGIPGALGPAQVGNFDATTPRLYAQLRVSDGVNVYASAANGFRSGGFNSQGPATYGPEDLWTYELGSKVSFFDARLSADLAVFFSDYGNIQINGVPLSGPPIGITSNAGTAELRGIEWTIAWSPIEQWSMDFSGYYIDSEFTQINLAATSHAVGDQLDLSPPYSFTVSLRRDFQWGARNGFARVDYDQMGRASYRNRSFSPTYFSESDVINLLNVAVGVDLSPNLSLVLYAQNLLNDRGYADPFSIEDYATRTRPRTAGLQFAFSLD